jgi:hypothetical protein
MKLLSTLFLALPLAALAQPQITAGNMPQVGDVYTYGFSYSDFDPAEITAASGANQTWDFSSFTVDEELTQSAVSAASTPFAAAFPDANLALMSNEVEYVFLSSTSTSLSSYGIAIGADESIALVYSNPELLYNLPFNHQTAFTDTYGGTSNIQGFDIVTTGEVSTTGDAYGTLILPSGTYPNCVRVYSTVTETVSFLGFPSVSTIQSWTWFSADHRYVMASFEAYTTSDGKTQETSYMAYVRSAVGPTTVEASAAVSHFSISPNPMQAGNSVSINWPVAETVDLAVLNLAGQVVFTDRVTLQAGRNSLNPALAAQPTGVYFMRVVDAKGALSVQRLVIR